MDEPGLPPTPSHASAAPASSPEQTDRRSYLRKVATLVIGGVVSVIPAVAGLSVLLDPLRRRSDTRGMVRVASLASLPDGGEPRKLPVLDTQIDAWNRTDNVPVGAVYVQKTGPNAVRVLNVVCPHLGCSVSFSGSKKHFYCPCHRSSFSVDGSILDPASPSPRAMDELEAEIRGDEVWVRFQNFRKGTPDKIPV
jgi:menaquinol-cytochrome c reductase iron-sulfur subunit